MRPGHTLVELLAVLPLALLLAALVITAVVAQTRLARRLADLAGRAEAERIAAAVLPAELRWAAAGDLRTGSTDSVRTRVFRGFAVPCGRGSAYTWYGTRAPAPAKDSLLIVGTAGEDVVALEGATVDGACGGYRLEAASALPDGVVLVFETGTYYLRQRALRFRAGGEGRQPLTEEWFVDGATALQPGADGDIVTALQLALRPAAGEPQPVPRRVVWAQPNRAPREAP